ncbi:MAG: VanZ family protein [Bacteroidota bacterium]
MIATVYNWLNQHKWLNAFLFIIYYLIAVLPHEIFGAWIAKTFDEPYGRDTYNLMVLAAGVIGLVGYLTLLWRGAKQLPTGRPQLWISFAATLLLILLCFNTILVVNVEIIHFVQYALLALLLFPLLNNYRDTLFFAMLLGAIDEAYQYLYLAPNNNYFDFNDVIIDLIGAALGLLLLWASGIRNSSTNQKWYKTPTFIGLMALVALTIIGFWMDFIAVYPIETGAYAPVQLIKKIQEGFWTIIHPNVKFHVVQPLEGLLILGALFGFYIQYSFAEKHFSKSV